MAGPGRPGRINKGDRDQFITRVARPVGDSIRAKAAAAGMSYTDYVAIVLAEHEGMPELAPRPQVASGQDVFPTSAGGDKLQRSA